MKSEQQIQQIHELVREYFFYDTGFKVGPDGKVDAVGNWELKYALNDQIPVQFGVVNGNLNVSNCGLTTLKGCGDWITGTLNASSNLITNLEGVPPQVGSIDLSNNQELTSLEGAPLMVRNFMDLTRTKLTSLKGLPTEPGAIGKIAITYQDHLPMLRLLVAKQIEVKKSGFGYSYLESKQPLQNILNDDRWAGKGKSHMLNCALELKQAGFVGNAAW